MIDLTLNSFLHPDLVGLKPPFGTIIERTAENKGGLSTAQTDNNMAMPFALMRPVTVATSDTTSNVEYDAKLLLTGDTPLTIHLDDAAYEGCTVTIVNDSTAQATLIAVGKLNGTDAGTLNLPIGRIAVLTWRAGWITLQETTSEGAFSAPPLGFIYIQFRKQADPNTLFPGTTWQNISSTYAGRFFRAEGGAAAAFGSQQAGGLPNIQFTARNNSVDNRLKPAIQPINGALYNTDNALEKTNYPATNPANTGFYTNDTMLTFDASRSSSLYGAATEVRPINETIRIWKRTG